MALEVIGAGFGRLRRRYGKHPRLEKHLSVLDDHIAEVGRVVLADKLPVYEVKGEAALPVSRGARAGSAFPWLNDSAAFDRQTRPKFLRRRAKGTVPTPR